ncbi:MAG: TfoX/Sxy family protein [Deltaproteobacteria bacterium]
MHDERTAARVRALLEAHDHVDEKRVMGRLAFMVEGAMACSVGEAGLLIAVTPDEREAVLGLEHVTPMVLRGRTMRGFVRVAREGYRTRAALAAWLDRGVTASRSKKRAKGGSRGRSRP